MVWLLLLACRNADETATGRLPERCATLDGRGRRARSTVEIGYEVMPDCP